MLGSVYGDRSFDKDEAFYGHMTTLLDHMWAEQHWTEESQNKEHVARIAEETMDRGWNVSARVHCYIWGNEIGR